MDKSVHNPLDDILSSSEPIRLVLEVSKLCEIKKNHISDVRKCGNLILPSIFSAPCLLTHKTNFYVNQGEVYIAYIYTFATFN